MRLIRIIILVSFLFNSFGPIPMAQADALVLPSLPQIQYPQSLAIAKGLTIDPKNPLQFDLIVEPSNGTAGRLPESVLREESLKLIKYFLASVTTPEKDMWVNLSPYEKNRIIPDGFGQTLMGRDLLADDYILKQVTASLIHPDSQTGKEFWAKVYKQAQTKYGTTNIPINTFNKVWIMPDKATVWEHGQSVFVVERHLKVMLEEDYVSMSNNSNMSSPNASIGDPGIAEPLGSRQKHSGTTNVDVNQIGSQIVREIVIPALEKEVNEGETFAQLRQIYNAMILATWFKKRLKDSLLGKIYMDQNKVKGVNVGDVKAKDKIYQQYLSTFKKGVFNFIKEEADPVTGEMIPRKYFSGGAVGLNQALLSTIDIPIGRLSQEARNMLPTDRAMKVTFKTAEPDSAMSTTPVADKDEGVAGDPDGKVILHLASKFRSQQEMRRFLEKSKAKRDGWWVAFDVDQASNLLKTVEEEKSFRVILAHLNQALFDRLDYWDPQFYSTWNNDHVDNDVIKVKEEGYIYIPFTVPQQRILQTLHRIQSYFKERTGQTVAMALMSASWVEEYDHLIGVMKLCLDDAKGNEVNKREGTYGDKVVVYYPQQGYEKRLKARKGWMDQNKFITQENIHNELELFLRNCVYYYQNILNTGFGVSESDNQQFLDLWNLLWNDFKERWLQSNKINKLNRLSKEALFSEWQDFKAKLQGGLLSNLDREFNKLDDSFSKDQQNYQFIGFKHNYLRLRRLLDFVLGQDLAMSTTPVADKAMVTPEVARTKDIMRRAEIDIAEDDRNIIRLMDQLNIQKDQRVLSVGPSRDVAHLIFAALKGADVEVNQPETYTPLGTSVSRPHLRYLREVLAAVDDPIKELIKIKYTKPIQSANIQSIPGYDYVVLVGVLDGVYDLEKKEIARKALKLIKDGGVVILGALGNLRKQIVREVVMNEIKRLGWSVEDVGQEDNVFALKIHKKNDGKDKAMQTDSAMQASINDLVDIKTKALNLEIIDRVVKESAQLTAREFEISEENFMVFVSGGMRYLGTGQRKDMDLVFIFNPKQVPLRAVKAFLKYFDGKLRVYRGFGDYRRTENIEYVTYFVNLPAATDKEKPPLLTLDVFIPEYDGHSWGYQFLKNHRTPAGYILETLKFELTKRSSGNRNETSLDFIRSKIKAYLAAEFYAGDTRRLQWKNTRQVYLKAEKGSVEQLTVILQDPDLQKRIQELVKELSDESQEKDLLARITQRLEEPLRNLPIDSAMSTTPAAAKKKASLREYLDGKIEEGDKFVTSRLAFLDALGVKAGDRVLSVADINDYQMGFLVAERGAHYIGITGDDDGNAEMINQHWYGRFKLDDNGGSAVNRSGFFFLNSEISADIPDHSQDYVISGIISDLKANLIQGANANVLRGTLRVIKNNGLIVITTPGIPSIELGGIERTIQEVMADPEYSARYEIVEDRSFKRTFYEMALTIDAYKAYRVRILNSKEAKLDMAMLGEQKHSRHVSRMETMAQYLKRNQDVQYLFVDPTQTDILSALFAGRKVLNIAPEDNSYSWVLNSQNLMTGLRERGIEAWALSPAEPKKEWAQWFFKDVIENMKSVASDSIDDVVNLTFFDPGYGAVDISDYPRVAQELRRVLKDQGRLFIDDYHSHDERLAQELIAVGFVRLANVTPEHAVYVNHKGRIGSNKKASLQPASVDAAMKSDAKPLKSLAEFVRRQLAMPAYTEREEFLNSIGVTKGQYVMSVADGNDTLIGLLVANRGAHYTGITYGMGLSDDDSIVSYRDFNMNENGGSAQHIRGMFINGSDASAQIKDRSQDVVISGIISDPRTRIEDNVQVLKETLRIINDNGRIIITTQGIPRVEESQVDRTILELLQDPEYSRRYEITPDPSFKRAYYTSGVTVTAYKAFRVQILNPGAVKLDKAMQADTAMTVQLTYKHKKSSELGELKKEIVSWGYFNEGSTLMDAQQVVLAYDGQQLVGAYFIHTTDKPTAQGYGISVKREYQKRQIGIRLVEEAFKQLKAQGKTAFSDNYVFDPKDKDFETSQGLARKMERIFQGHVTSEYFGKYVYQGQETSIIRNLSINLATLDLDKININGSTDEAMTAERQRQWKQLGVSAEALERAMQNSNTFFKLNPADIASEWESMLGLGREDVKKAVEVAPRLLGLSVADNLKPMIDILHQMYGENPPNIISKLGEIYSQNVQVLQVIMQIAKDKQIEMTVDRLKNTYRGINQRIKKLKNQNIADWISQDTNYRSDREFQEIVEQTLEQTRKKGKAKTDKAMLSVELNDVLGKYFKGHGKDFKTSILVNNPYSSEWLTIKGDFTDPTLDGLIHELVKNAIDEQLEGLIHVDVRKEAGKVIVSVSNDGEIKWDDLRAKVEERSIYKSHDGVLYAFQTGDARKLSIAEVERLSNEEIISIAGLSAGIKQGKMGGLGWGLSDVYYGLKAQGASLKVDSKDGKVVVSMIFNEAQSDEAMQAEEQAVVADQMEKSILTQLGVAEEKLYRSETTVAGQTLAVTQYKNESEERVRFLRVGKILIVNEDDLPQLTHEVKEYPYLIRLGASRSRSVKAANMFMGLDYFSRYSWSAYTIGILAGLQAHEDQIRQASFIDAGAGISGLCSIAAAKLGAAELVVIESDSTKLDELKHNLAQNGITQYQLQTKDFRTMERISTRHPAVFSLNLSYYGVKDGELAALLERVSDVTLGFVSGGAWGLQGLEDKVKGMLEGFFHSASEQISVSKFKDNQVGQQQTFVAVKQTDEAMQADFQLDLGNSGLDPKDAQELFWRTHLLEKTLKRVNGLTDVLSNIRSVKVELYSNIGTIRVVYLVRVAFKSELIPEAKFILKVTRKSVDTDRDTLAHEVRNLMINKYLNLSQGVMQRVGELPNRRIVITGSLLEGDSFDRFKSDEDAQQAVIEKILMIWNATGKIKLSDLHAKQFIVKKKDGRWEVNWINKGHTQFKTGSQYQINLQVVDGEIIPDSPDVELSDVTSWADKADETYITFALKDDLETRMDDREEFPDPDNEMLQMVSSIRFKLSPKAWARAVIRVFGFQGAREFFENFFMQEVRGKDKIEFYKAIQQVDLEMVGSLNVPLLYREGMVEKGQHSASDKAMQADDAFDYETMLVDRTKLFESSTQMRRFIRERKEALAQGWWIAFDVDQAAKLPPDEPGYRIVQMLNGQLMKSLGLDPKTRFFGTGRTDEYNEKEEGFVYLSSNIPQEQSATYGDRSIFYDAQAGYEQQIFAVKSAPEASVFVTFENIHNEIAAFMERFLGGRTEYTMYLQRSIKSESWQRIIGESNRSGFLSKGNRLRELWNQSQEKFQIPFKTKRASNEILFAAFFEFKQTVRESHVLEELEAEYQKLLKTVGADIGDVTAFRQFQRSYEEFRNRLKIALGDQAAVAKAPGGIDMNSNNLELSIKRDGQGIPLPTSLQNWSNIRIDGLTPVIIKIAPVNLQELIGVGT